MSDQPTTAGWTRTTVQTPHTCGYCNAIHDPGALAVYRADLAARVRALPPTMSQHTCWDDHEGGMDAEGQPTLHADGSTCHDRVIGESVDRAAVLAEIEEETR